MPFSPIDLLAGFFFTWVLGLVPALIARRIHGEPLPRKRANLIAGVSCSVFALIGLMLKTVAGEANPRVSPAWILVFVVSRWIMIRGDKSPITAGAPSHLPASGTEGSTSRLSRGEIIARLNEIVADPATTDYYRTQAKIRLNELQRREARKATARFPLNLKRVLARVRPNRSSTAVTVRLLAFVVAADLLLVISGYRFLVRERTVQPGENYIAGDWGDLGSYDRPTISCWYWTGRKLIPEVSWYGPGKSERDECSVIHRHQQGE